MPYMTDARHAPDTFFIVAEADHRFYAADCIKPEEWLAHASEMHYGKDEADKERKRSQPEGEEEYEVEPCADGSKGKSKPGRKKKAWERTLAESSAGNRRAYGAWTAGCRPLGGQGSTEPGITDELRGLVAMANQAARRGCGDIIWFSWNPTKTAGLKRQPSYGSNLIGITKAGAQLLQHHMKVAEKKYHFDIFIRDIGRGPCQSRCCYVYPPVGNFETHKSGVEQNMERESLFPTKWFVGQPVIPVPGSHAWERQLCKMSGVKGFFEPIGEPCAFDDWQQTWWTAAPPSSPDDADDTWQWLIWENWWSQNYQWIGPEVMQGGARKFHKHAKLLRDRPEEFINYQEVWSPISLLASELVVDHPAGARDKAHLSERVCGVRRKNLLTYKARKFCDTTQACQCARQSLSFFYATQFHKEGPVQSLSLAPSLIITPSGRALRRLQSHFVTIAMESCPLPLCA